MSPLSVNSEEARKMIGVSASTLYRLRKSGQIKARPVNPKAKSPTWLYLVASLRAYAEGDVQTELSSKE